MSERGEHLETVFGGPSDDAFGSAVFRRALPGDAALEPLAREIYRDFVGELWDRLGADAWLAPWSLAAARAQGSAQSVVDLLDTLEDLATRSAADMLVNANPDPEAAPDALREAFDHDGISELKVFTIGDGEAMSGLLIAAQDRETSEAIVLVFLMD